MWDEFYTWPSQGGVELLGNWLCRWWKLYDIVLSTFFRKEVGKKKSAHPVVVKLFWNTGCLGILFCSSVYPLASHIEKMLHVLGRHGHKCCLQCLVLYYSGSAFSFTKTPHLNALNTKWINNQMFKHLCHLSYSFWPIRLGRCIILADRCTYKLK